MNGLGGSLAAVGANLITLSRSRDDLWTISEASASANPQIRFLVSIASLAYRCARKLKFRALANVFGGSSARFRRIKGKAPIPDLRLSLARRNLRGARKKATKNGECGR